MNTTKTTIQALLSQLDFVETASVIHTASEALRHTCGFARCYADLGTNIPLLHDTEEDCDWIRADIEDIRDEKELTNLITAASFRLQMMTLLGQKHDYTGATMTMREIKKVEGFDWRKLLINATTCFSLIGGFSAVLGLASIAIGSFTKNHQSDTVQSVNWELTERTALHTSALAVFGAMAGSLALYVGDLEVEENV